MKSAEPVLITGSGWGLGLEIALHLAERGFRVYATMPDLSEREKLDEAVARRGVDLRVLRLDVTDEQSIAEAIGTVVEECGGLYGLVNNAGVALRGYFEDLDEDEIRRLFAINVFGTMAVTRAALPVMREARRGRIAFITSIGGRIGSLAVSAYSSTKFAIEGYGESLHQEVAPLGIGVSLVAPSVIPTERFGPNRGYARRAFDPQSPYHAWFVESQRLTDKLVETSPTKPADVAKAVHHALSAKHPHLHYTVGWRASLALTLRRLLPGDLFERVYFGEIMRRVTKAPKPEKEPAETAQRG